MKHIGIIGRIIYCIGVIGVGILHFFYSGFRPLILPIPASEIEHLKFLPILTGTILLFAGTWIALAKNIRFVSVSLGIILLMFFLFGHLPNRLLNHPEILGVWTDGIKLLALAGGAFTVASYNTTEINSFSIDNKVLKISALGQYLFALMLILFGIDHFLYVDLVKSLIPQWIPFKYFWTYSTGIALICSGLSIVFNFLRQPISLLLGIMLLLWLLLLHLPATLASQDKEAVNIISSLECLAFSGIAFLITTNKKTLLK